jgi:peptidyl-tRNA hydrolase
MAILPVRLCVPFAALLVRSPSTTLLHSTRTRSLSSLSSTINKMASNDEQQEGAAQKKKPIVQYIFLRRDLEDWPAGAMAAQAAHVSVAAITQAVAAKDDDALEYVAPENLPHMTKYVYGVDNLAELEEVRAAWNELIQSTTTTAIAIDDKDAALMSYWWLEQPENIPTAFGTWPITRTNKVSKVIKNLKVSFF